MQRFVRSTLCCSLDFPSWCSVDCKAGDTLDPCGCVGVDCQWSCVCRSIKIVNFLGGVVASLLLSGCPHGTYCHTLISPSSSVLCSSSQLPQSTILELLRTPVLDLQTYMYTMKIILAIHNKKVHMHHSIVFMQISHLLHAMSFFYDWEDNSKNNGKHVCLQTSKKNHYSYSLAIFGLYCIWQAISVYCHSGKNLCVKLKLTDTEAAMCQCGHHPAQ